MNADKYNNRWRLWLGAGILLLSIALPVGAILLSFFGPPVTRSALAAFVFAGGFPEILCLLAIAILGKENFEPTLKVVKRTRLHAPLAAPASRLRYYAGLIGCLLNGLPLTLYAYVPELMPDGKNRFFILAAADLVFIYSVFMMGGEFWEKFRRLFIWEGSSQCGDPVRSTKS